MPIFEFQCEDHGVFEVLRNSIPDDQHYACPVCDVPAPFIWSKPIMRPDTMWAGHYVPGRGYFTSKSQLDKTMKQQHHVPVGDRSDAEGMRAMARKAAEARDAKFAEESKEFMRQQMAKRGLLDAEGNLIPEASKPLSDTPLISTNDDRVKS